MKKIFCAVTASLFLSACSASPRMKASQTVSACISAIDHGHLDAAGQYVDSDQVRFISDISDQYSGIEELLSEYNASSETKEKMDNALVTLTDAAVSSASVSSSEENEDGSYTVRAVIQMVPSSDISSVLQKADLDSYLTDIQDDVMKIYDEKGEEEAWQYALNKLADFISENCTEEMKKAQKKDLNLDFTVKQVNENWIITSIDEQNS